MMTFCVFVETQLWYLALVMAHVLFETHMFITMVNILIKMHLAIIIILMFLMKHRPKSIMLFK